MKAPSDLEDARLARDFADRRPDALAAAYRAYSQILYSVARNSLGSDRDAEDCVHDALLRVWQRAGSYRTERGSLRSYLIVCVRNEATSRQRADSRHARIEERAFLDVPQTYDLEFNDGSQAASLRQAIAALPDEQRQVLELSYFGNLTHAQIADRLGIPLGTIKSRLMLSMQKLKSAFHQAR